MGSNLYLGQFVSRQGAFVFRDALSHPRGQRLFGVPQVVGHLQVHPELRRRLEKRSQPDCRVPCEATFILQSRRDPVGRHPRSPSRARLPSGCAVSKLLVPSSSLRLRLGF